TPCPSPRSPAEPCQQDPTISSPTGPHRWSEIHACRSFFYPFFRPYDFFLVPLPLRMTIQRLWLYCVVSEAFRGVVVHHSNGLHERVADSRADEPEASFA